MLFLTANRLSLITSINILKSNYQANCLHNFHAVAFSELKTLFCVYLQQFEHP
jgi:hypothetical protein